MNQHKKAVAVILAVLMIFSITAFAVDARASSKINGVYANLYVTNGDLCVSFTIYAIGTMDTIGASQIDIQRYNGSRWVTEKTLTVRDYPEMQTSSASWYYASVIYTPDYTGATYQAVVTAYAKDSSEPSTSQATTAQVRT